MALCEGNPLVTVGCPSQRALMREVLSWHDDVIKMHGSDNANKLSTNNCSRRALVVMQTTIIRATQGTIRKILCHVISQTSQENDMLHFYIYESLDLCIWVYVKTRVVLMPTLSSLATAEVALMTTVGAASDIKVGIWTNVRFPCWSYATLC